MPSLKMQKQIFYLDSLKSTKNLFFMLTKCTLWVNQLSKSSTSYTSQLCSELYVLWKVQFEELLRKMMSSSFSITTKVILTLSFSCNSNATININIVSRIFLNIFPDGTLNCVFWPIVHFLMSILLALRA